MQDHNTSKKGHRLTLYIIIALIAGIVLAFVLNGTYVKTENIQIASAEDSLNFINQSLSKITDTTSFSYQSLEETKARMIAEKAIMLEARDNKLDPFSLLADIFLRLIKMIVAPLVFTTLVVGVAKLGDIKSVGRIGGKTLVWFFRCIVHESFTWNDACEFFQAGYCNAPAFAGYE